MNKENMNILIERLKNIESQAFNTIYVAKGWIKEINNACYDASKESELNSNYLRSCLLGIENDLVEINRLIAKG